LVELEQAIKTFAEQVSESMREAGLPIRPIADVATRPAFMATETPNYIKEKGLERADEVAMNAATHLLQGITQDSEYEDISSIIIKVTHVLGVVDLNMISDEVRSNEKFRQLLKAKLLIWKDKIGAYKATAKQPGPAYQHDEALVRYTVNFLTYPQTKAAKAIQRLQGHGYEIRDTYERKGLKRIETMFHDSEGEVGLKPALQTCERAIAHLQKFQAFGITHPSVLKNQNLQRAIQGAITNVLNICESLHGLFDAGYIVAEYEARLNAITEKDLEFRSTIIEYKDTRARHRRHR